ncbi:MAG TPA: ACT domain-containing protein [Phycisphaerae bacterium]|nr:ACT domain-containing protein [Phycisphaerae bacterium]
MKTRFEHAYVLNVVADDHPGIVAAVCGAIDELGGNIDSCSQTVLKGYFTLIMIVSVPEEAEPARLVEGVQGRGTDLQVIVRPYTPPGFPPVERAERFVITAFGQDKPGIIRRFTQYLAGKDVNIVDLYGDLSGEEFVLISEVEIPSRWEISSLQADLEQIGREEGFTVRLQHEDIFVATNQLRMSRRECRTVGR